MTESNSLPSIDTPFGALQIEQSPWIMQDPYSFQTGDLALTTELGEVHLSFHLDVSEKRAIPSGLRCVFAVGKLTPVGDDRPALELADGRSVGWLVHAVIPDASTGEMVSPMSVTLYDFATGTDFKSRRLHDEALDRLGVSIDLDADVDSLPTSGKQIVAIARAVMADARLIIMDEPTTALTRHEVDALFKIVRDIQAQGIAVLFVSHKMREMLEISERLTIFRNGRKVAEGPISDFDESSIARAMTGQDLAEQRYHWSPREGAAATPILDVQNLSVHGSVEKASLTLHAGEIVGVSGLIGSGRTELALALFGMKPDFTGTMRIDGRDVHPKSVQEAIASGIAYVPEDRLTEGLFLTQSIERNIIVTSIEKFVRGLFIDRKKADATTRDMFSAMHIVAPGPHTPVNHLSGGNAQRVVLARWLLTGAKVLILNGPTVGVDIGSKAQIHAIIRNLAETEGLAVLMISDDVPELVQNCNRVLVMHRGRFVDELTGDSMTEDAVNDRLKALN